MTAKRFVILGASLDTGNLGVSALLASTVQEIVKVTPDAEIQLLAGVRNPVPQVVRLANGRKVELARVGVRCSKTVWRQDHVLRLLAAAVLSKLLPSGLRARWLRKNPYLHAIVDARAVMDITGGDSFSDIYGLKRLAFGCLYKFLVMLTGTNLILLPQTYGPFKRSLARTLARVVLSGSAAVYSRDEEGLREIRKLMNGKPMRAVPEVCPDVAFTLDAIRGKTEQTKELERLRSHGQRIIGLNISGLLYNGGYTGKNDFNLKCDYKQVVLEVTRLFAAKDNHVVVLVPHVLPRNFPVENDLEACKALVQSLPAETRQKVIVLDGTYDQSEVKYLIGLCDFFMGARMHSTIAALSQCVPAVAMAYSKKFAGVFQTAGMEDCVVDMRTLSDEDVVQKITEIYANSDAVRARLEKIVPHIKRQVHKMFDDLLTSRQEGMAAGVGGDKAAVRGEDVRKAV